MAKTTDRKFKVLKHQVGPWSKDQVFSMETFKELHPIYDSTRPRPKSFDPETYHDGLIDRLIATGAVSETTPDAKESDLEPGPLAQPQEKVDDPVLRKVTQAVAQEVAATAKPEPAAKTEPKK